MEIKEMSYREALRLAMSEEMRRDEDVIFLGEDIGVYGGTFHVSTGMLDEFG
ncbi:MAG: alpha-ketoacid dehydrogenase subunit beta, partial [Eubacterium sp.]